VPIVLIDLGTLVILVGALILCYLVVYFTKAFFGVAGTLLGKLPIVGGWIDAGAHAIEQRITYVFGTAAAKVEVAVGATWHATARLVDWMGREIARHADLFALIATLINPVQAIGTIQRALHEARYLLGLLAHRLEGIGHDVIIRTRTIEHGIGADVLPRIRTLEREYGRVIGRTIPRIRAGERATEREITNLWKWTRKHTLVAGTGAFAAAVALALSALGLDWIRCKTAQNVFKRRGCNLWNDLEALVVAGTAVAAGMSLVELAKAEQEIVGDLATVVKDFWQV
jgi:hypothetical protein